MADYNYSSADVEIAPPAAPAPLAFKSSDVEIAPPALAPNPVSNYGTPAAQLPGTHTPFDLTAPRTVPSGFGAGTVAPAGMVPGKAPAVAPVPTASVAGTPDYAAISRKMADNPPAVPKPTIPDTLKPDEQLAKESPSHIDRFGNRVQDVPMGQSFLDFPYNAAVNAVHGVEALATPTQEIYQQKNQLRPGGTPVSLSPDAAKAAARGAGNLVAAGFDAATPLMVAGGVAAPVEAGAALLTGMYAKARLEDSLRQSGVAPEYASLAGDIAAIVAGYGGHEASLPEGVHALVNTVKDGGSSGNPAVDADRIAKLTELAQNGASPEERNAAKNVLRTYHGIDIPDEAPVHNWDGAPTEPAAAQPPPPPQYNSAEFTKAHAVWNTATNKAATSFMEANPGVSFDEAKQAVAGTVGVEPMIDNYKAPPPPPEPPAPAPEVKPEPPAKVEKVSPATPNAPTAATPTQPESPETIALQMGQMGAFGAPVQDSQRKAVMFPGGQGMPDLSTMAGLKITHDEFGNVYAYRPDLIDPSEIKRAAKSNKLPEVLGGPMGMGAPDKANLQGPPVAVVGKAPDGTEAQTTVTDAVNLPQTVAATHAVTPVGGTVEVKAPDQALAERSGNVNGQQPGQEVIPSYTAEQVELANDQGPAPTGAPAHSPESGAPGHPWGDSNPVPPYEREIPSQINPSVAHLTTPRGQVQIFSFDHSEQDIPGQHLIVAVSKGAHAQTGPGTQANRVAVNKLAALGFQPTDIVGTADVVPNDNLNGYHSEGTYVDPAWQRNRIASTMYDHAESIIGEKLHPAGVRTTEGDALQKSRQPVQAIDNSADIRRHIERGKEFQGQAKTASARDRKRLLQLATEEFNKASALNDAQKKAAVAPQPKPVTPQVPTGVAGATPALGVKPIGNRTIQNGIRRIDAALLAEAQKKAEAENNTYMQTILRAINLKNMSTSDRDTLNTYLGIPDGTMVDHRKPGPEIAAASTPPGPRQTDLLKPLSSRESSSAAKKLNIDTSGYDLKTIEGRNALAAEIRKKKLTNSYKEQNADNPDLGAEVAGASPADTGTVGAVRGSVPEGNGSVPVRGHVPVEGAANGSTAAEPAAGHEGAGLRGGVRKITGSADIPLSPAGEQQAENEADTKIVKPLKFVVSADSQRGIGTAEKFAPHAIPGATVTTSNVFDGWPRGIYEGQPMEAVKDEMSRLTLNPDEVPPGVSPISGEPGKSWNQMAKPMFAEVARLHAMLAPDENGLIITSGGNLQAIDAWGKAGYPADFEFPHDEIAASPYWSVTGKMFRLGANGLDEVADNSQPGLNLTEHAETAFNSKGGDKGVPLNGGRESEPGSPVQRPGQADLRPLGGESPELRPEPQAAEPVAGGSGSSGGATRTDVQQQPAGGVSGGPGGRTGAGAVESTGEPSGGRVTGDLTRQTEGGDFRIAPSDHIGEGTPRQKLGDNLEAIRTVKAIDKESRKATPEEQEKLAKYVGWGGLWQIFDWRKPEWSGAREELRGLLSPDEWRAAEASTKNAHYTSPEVIAAMWNAMRRFGVNPGFSVLEPSMGIGTFFGMQPDALMPARRTGVELDKITGAMAKALYPDSNVQITGFEKMSLPNDFFDMSIGNVPFGNYPVYDPQYKRNKVAVGAIHNYFFVKSLDLTRPGGIVAFITSRYTMDAQDPALRDLLASKANLVGMMRLPNTAFKGNAGTQVVTDVIFLQKRPEGESPSGPAFANTVAVPTESGEPAIVNEYYAAHPEMLLGKLSMEGTQYGPNQQTLEGKLTPEMLQQAIERLPAGIYSEWKAESPAFEDNPDFVQLGDEVKDGGYAVKDGVIVQRQGNIYRPAITNDKQAARIRGMIPVRGALRQVFETQLSDAPEQNIVAARQQLNKTYDAFVKTHGPLNSAANARALGDDPDYLPLSGALENYDRETKQAEKTDIFSKRTIEKPQLPDKADTAAEALAMVLNERGRLDWNRMQELTGRTPDQIRDELAGQVFQNPDGRKWETQDEYLSGNVRKKLDMAETAAKVDPTFTRNVEALKRVQPPDLIPDEIKITPGAPWIPAETVTQFVRQTLGLDGADVHYAPSVAAWSITVPKYQRERVANAQTYGNEDFFGHELFDMALNGKAPRVYQDGPNDTRIFDPKATAVAQAAQDSIKDRFREWVWEQPERANMLAAKYNKEVNNLRQVDHDGSFLTLPGSNPGIILRPHQKNVIWRALKTGNTLLAHEVGAGKTWEMSGIAMESRRLGIAKKPMIAVPNHMAEQFSKEFQQLYPAARILTIGREDFAADNRKRAVSRIAGGNWDAVIIRHSSFEKIPVSDETYQSFVDTQIAELRAALEEQSKETGSTEKKKDKTVKEIEKAISRLEVKLEKHLNRENKDNAVTFEQLGVDLLMVDEAHAFKALPIITRRTRVAGIPTRESNRATDMFMKTQYVSRLNGGRRGVVFATGTPVTNTMAELYNMQRYLQPQAMRDAGVEHFDAWANMFGDVRRGVELDVSGKGFRENTRFAKFINIPELMTMYRQVADVKTAEMMKLPRPELEGGAEIPIIGAESPELIAYIDHLIDRSEEIRAGNVDKRVDNMLKVVSEGKKAALDMRLVDPLAQDRPTSKVNRTVAEIFKIWKGTTGDRATQIVFCDLSTPKSAKAKKSAKVPEDVEAEEESTAVPEAAGELAGFSVYDDMRRKLINSGIPVKEIAFIHDYASDEQKQGLFDAVNAGRVRVLFGSTEKMGVGTNVQRRAYALYNMDAPWRPADIKQRIGRIVRQGNMHSKVRVYQGITEGSFDAYSWQLLENKAAFIGPILSGDSTIREMEDVGMILPSAAEFKAMASGNPLIKEKIGTDAELGRLEAQRNAFQRQQSGIKREMATLPDKISGLKKGIATAQVDANTVEAHKDDGYTIGTQHFTGKDAHKNAGIALHDAFLSWAGPGVPQKIGTYKGLEIWTRPVATAGQYPNGALQGKLTYSFNTFADAPSSTLQSIEASIRNNVRVPGWMPQELADAEIKLMQLEPLLDRTWKDEKRYKDLAQRKIEIDAKLDESEAEKSAAAEDGDTVEKAVPKGTSYTERKRILLARERGENVDYSSSAGAAKAEGGDQRPASSVTLGSGPAHRPRTALRNDSHISQTSSDKDIYTAADAQYERPSRASAGHGHIYLNPIGAELAADMMSASGLDVSPFEGVTLTKWQTQKLIDFIQPFTQNDPFAAKLVQEISASRADNPVTTFIRAGDGSSLAEIQRTRREEAFHRAQRSSPSGNVYYIGESLGNTLLDDPEVAEAMDKIRKIRITANPNQEWEEFGAVFASGQGNQIGYNEPQSASLLRKYVDTLIATNGPQAGTVLKMVTPQMRKALGDEYVKQRWNGRYHAPEIAEPDEGSLEGAGPSLRPRQSDSIGTQAGSTDSLGELREPAGSVSERTEAADQGPGSSGEIAHKPSVTIGSGLGAFQPYVEKFYEQDIKPAAKSISQHLTGAFDDMKKAFAPQTRGPAARRTAGLVRERGAEMDQRRDRAIAMMDGMKAHFYKDTPEQHGFYGLDEWNAIETGRTMGLSAVDRQFALAARTLLDARRDELMDLGILKTYVEDYLPREYKNPEDASRWIQNWLSKRPMEGSKAFLRQRTYATLKEGLEDPDFTLVPKFDNPVDMLLSKLGQMDQAITAHRVFNEMHAKGDLKYVRAGQRAPVGWQKIDDKLFTVNGPKYGGVSVDPNKQERKPQRSDFGLGPGRWNFPELGDDPSLWKQYQTALQDWRDTSVLPEDVRVEGQRVMGHYYAPEPIARVLNNHLSQGIDDTSAMKVWRGANNLMNMVQLSASYYHGLTTTLNSSFSDMALGIEQALNGRLLAGATSFGRGMVPFASVAQDYFKGTEIQKAWDMPAEDFEKLKYSDPVTWAIVDTLKAAGGKARQDSYYQTKFWDEMKRAWETGNPLGAIAPWRVAGAAIETSMKPIMEKLVPRVKLGAFAKLAVEEMQHHPTYDRDQMRAAFGQIWNSVDNRFGQLAQRNLLMHALARGSMNALVGRPGWNIGSVQEIGGGINGAAKNINDLLHGRTTRISHKTAFVIAMLLGGALLNGIVNRILSRTNPESLADFIAPRDGGTTEDGRPSRIILPTYLSKDLYSYATRPWETLKAKAAPFLSLTGDLLTNRDFQDQKIYGDRGVGLWNYLKGDVTPYSITGLLKNRERGASLSSQVAPFVGVMPAAKRVGLSKAERLITEYQDEQRANTKAPSGAHSKAQSQVFMAAKHGNLPEARKLGSADVAAGTMSPADVNRSIERARQVPLAADYKRVSDFATAMRIYDAATPEEKQVISREARNKVFSARAKAWDWKLPDGDPDTGTINIVRKYFPQALPRPAGLAAPQPIQ